MFAKKSVLKSFAKLIVCRSRLETWPEYFRMPVLSLLLESPIFWSFLSSNLTDVYLWDFWLILHISLFYLSSNNNHTNGFDFHKVCTVFVDWISCHPVFFFESMNWCKNEKKREKSSFTHGSGETIRVFNQVLSKMSRATKLKFFSAILQ